MQACCCHMVVTYLVVCVFLRHVCHTKNNLGKSPDQGPVVQSIVSLTISLRHKFVKQISAKVTNTLLFFVEKM